MLTLQDCMDDLGLRKVASACPGSADFTYQVNAATRWAMKRGDFSETLVPIYLCVRLGCVVFPRYVQTVRALAACSMIIQPENMWGSFLPRGKTAPWRSGLQWWGPSACQNMMVNQGRSPVFQDIQGDGRLVRAYLRCNNDENKTITIFGEDNNGQPLQHQDVVGGPWLPGVVLTLTKPFASTSVYVRRIDRVLLDAMECPVNLYAYNVAQNVLEDLAQYDAGETNPSFERVRLQVPWVWGAASGTCGSGSGCCTSPMGVTALVKLRFIPAVHPTDLVIIDNLDALKLIFQAEKFGEAGDRANRKMYQMDAIEDLNRQLETDSPDDQFVANNTPFGPAVFTNQCF